MINWPWNLFGGPKCGWLPQVGMPKVGASLVGLGATLANYVAG